MKRGDLEINGFRPCWFLCTISYKQTRLAPISYKDSRLKLLFPFQVWARLFCRTMYFFCFRNIFILIAWMCPLPYQTISNTFNKWNPNIICIWRLHFCNWSPKGDLTILFISSPQWISAKFLARDTYTLASIMWPQTMWWYLSSLIMFKSSKYIIHHWPQHFNKSKKPVVNHNTAKCSHKIHLHSHPWNLPTWGGEGMSAEGTFHVHVQLL